MSEKTKIKSLRVVMGDQLFVYEIGQIINGMQIAKIVTISDNVDKRNVVYCQDASGRTIMQANHVSYLAEHMNC